MTQLGACQQGISKYINAGNDRQKPSLAVTPSLKSGDGIPKTVPRDASVTAFPLYVYVKLVESERERENLARVYRTEPSLPSLPSLYDFG
jgi:hypothetical protein